LAIVSVNSERIRTPVAQRPTGEVEEDVFEVARRTVRFAG
jgi:hypothetical protein